MPSKKSNVKSSVPSARALSKAIESFMKLADEVFGPRFDEAKRLTHVHLLAKNAI